MPTCMHLMAEAAVFIDSSSLSFRFFVFCFTKKFQEVSSRKCQFLTGLCDFFLLCESCGFLEDASSCLWILFLCLSVEYCRSTAKVFCEGMSMVSDVITPMYSPPVYSPLGLGLGLGLLELG